MTTTFPTDDETSANARKGLSFARAAGVAIGLFMIAWIPFNATRWGGQAPAALLHIETVFFAVYGVMLVLPWRKITGKILWRTLFSLLIFLSLAFGFLMVIDLMFQYMLAADQAAKPAPPAFQSLMIFTALMQAPAVYFVRNPRAML